MNKPKSAYIFLTNRCNLDCKYCYEKNRTGDMTKETMKATIDFLVSHYNKQYHVRPMENLNFTFFGGEPLLNFPVVKYGLEYIREKSKEMDFTAGTYILTNGTILTDEMVEFFKSIRPFNNFNWHIQVSMDGCEDTHNANRVFHNGEGSYSRIIENVKKYKEIFPSVGIRQTLTPTTINSFFKDFVAMIELDTSNCNFTPIVEGDWNEEVLETFASELKKCIDYYYQHNKTSFFNLIHQSFERLRSPSFNEERGCRAGDDFIGISVEGKIYPCHRFVAYAGDNDFCLGDVWKGIDEEGANTKKVELMRVCEAHCHTCKVFSCNRCFATNMHLKKDPAALPGNGYCEMNKKISDTLRPIIGRLIMGGKLNLCPGEMVDMGGKGIAFRTNGTVEVAADKIDIMARCMLTLTKEIVNIKRILVEKKVTP